MKPLRLVTFLFASLWIGQPAWGQETMPGFSEQAMPPRLAVAGVFGGPRFLDLDSLEAGLRSRSVWRGRYLGSLPAFAALHMSLWRIDGVQDRHALVGRLSGELPLADRDDASRADLFQGGAEYRYRLDTQEGEAGFGVAGRLLADSNTTRSSTEVIGAIQRRFEVPGSERPPMFRLFVARDIQRFDATYVEPRVTWDFGLPPEDNNAASLGARLVLATSWSDHLKRSDVSGDFGYHATSLGAWFSRDWSSTAVGPLVAEVGLEKWWSRVGAEAHSYVASVHLVKR